MTKELNAIAIDRSAAGEPPDPTRFSGEVHIQLLYNTADGNRTQAVFFEASGRTRAHIHMNDQVLICIEGEGVVAAEDDAGHVKTILIRPHDTVRIPRNRWHWHGATRTSRMAHISVNVFDAGDKWDGVEERDWAEYNGG